MSRIKTYFKAIAGIFAATLVLAFFYFMSPHPPSRADLIVSKGKWTSVEGDGPFDVVAGREIAFQIPEASQCCSGSYDFEIPSVADVKSVQLQPALYISAIGCSKELSLNGASIPLSTREYTSVGPVIPLPTQSAQYPLKVRIEIECPRLMYTGIWKSPLRIGEFFDLVSFQAEERLFQKITPMVTGAIFLAMGITFVVIYIRTDRRFPFYLDVSFGLISWSVFLIFLSGLVREWNFWIGSTLHLPVRVMAACGAFFVVRSYLVVINDQKEQARSKSYPIILIYAVLSLACLYFSVTGEIFGSAVCTTIASVCAYLPVLRWPLRNLRVLSVGYIAFVVCLVTWLGAISDGIKLMEANLKYSDQVPYFNRYTANLFMATAVVLFLRHFIGLYRRLQGETLRAARATATGRAVRMIAHDVRAPFTSLRIGIGLLKKAKGSQDRLDDLISRLESHLNQSFDRVNRMLKDVMDFGGELHLEKICSSVTDIVSLTLEAGGNTQNSAIVIDVQADCSLLVDREKIARALHNVLENALQASNPEDKVSFHARSIEQANRVDVVFSIHNFGKIILPENLGKVFTEFYSSGKKGGTGLGLAIAKEFVEAHGGSISCESDEIKGTWFHIRLPSSL